MPKPIKIKVNHKTGIVSGVCDGLDSDGIVRGCGGDDDGDMGVDIVMMMMVVLMVLVIMVVTIYGGEYIWW